MVTKLTEQQKKGLNKCAELMKEINKNYIKGTFKFNLPIKKKSK
jgi:hypothetical protein